MHRFLADLERELRLDPLNVQINQTKKKLESLDMKLFCRYRDETDAYQIYLRCVQRLRKILDQKPMKVKQVLGTSFLIIF